jgi:outer membrane lipoprotein SlyB
MRAQEDHGQAAPLAVALVAIALVALVAVGHFAVGVLDAARARTAADAAALAGAVAGREAAAQVAAANGAVLVSYRDDGLVVSVEVTVDGARSSASASLVPAPP